MKSKSFIRMEKVTLVLTISHLLFSTPQDRWQELARDVELGSVSGALALEPTSRSRLEALMKPDPGRASQLRAHFQRGSRGLAKRLWPRLHLVLAVDSGSNQIYGETLRGDVCEGVPFFSPFYAATEGGHPHAIASNAETADSSFPRCATAVQV